MTDGRRGSVRQASNGSWFFIVDIGSGTERRQTRRRGFPTKKAAQAALTHILETLSKQSYVAPSRLTLEDFIEQRWLPAVKSSLRSSTHESYSRNLRLHVIPVLGSMPLQAVDAGSLTALYQRLTEDGRKDHKFGKVLSTTTVRYIHTIVRSALQMAYEWDLVPRNAADRAKPPKPKARGDRHDQFHTWDRRELGRFLAATEDDRLYPLWLLLATTGMRRGEALGLSWQAIDFGTSRLSVRRSLVDVDRGEPIWSDPKTASGRRSISLDGATLAALRSEKSRQARDRLLVGPAYTDLASRFHVDGRDSGV
jgi:integrase